MLDSFLQILPEMIFEAAEKLGGRCTGRFYALNALENRVYKIEMEEGPHVSSNSTAPAAGVAIRQGYG